MVRNLNPVLFWQLYEPFVHTVNLVDKSHVFTSKLSCMRAGAKLRLKQEEFSKKSKLLTHVNIDCRNLLPISLKTSCEIKKFEIIVRLNAPVTNEYKHNLIVYVTLCALHDFLIRNYAIRFSYRHNQYCISVFVEDMKKTASRNPSSSKHSPSRKIKLCQCCDLFI